MGIFSYHICHLDLLNCHQYNGKAGIITSLNATCRISDTKDIVHAQYVRSVVYLGHLINSPVKFSNDRLNNNRYFCYENIVEIMFHFICYPSVS